MHVLLVKTSSLGDVIHNLPVVSDLKRMHPEAQIDWCAEESCAAIPRLHPGVREVIPVALRRWRKTPFAAAVWREFADFRRRLGAQRYDFVLDTQGLVKSALIASQANGLRCGYAAGVAREPFAARFYDRTFVIPTNANAVLRNRWLAAAAFDYPVDLPLDYGLAAPELPLPWLEKSSHAPRHAVLLTATSRDDKLWSEDAWGTVARELFRQGITPILPSGSARERERTERIAAQAPGCCVAPPLGLPELAALTGRAAVAVGVDTGLVHLAAALGTPTIALYTATDPERTGVLGTGFFRNLGGPGLAPSPDAVLAAIDQGLRA